MLLPFDPPDDDTEPALKAEVRPDLGFGGDPGAVTLLLGPPRGGKTRVLLDRYLAAYRAGLADGRVGRCVWITPNRLSREAVAADMAAEVGGPLLGHGVLTFENLTDALLAEAPGAGRRRLGAVSRRRVLRAVVDGALARGELSHFAGIARTAGFLGLLDRQIRSWKYEEVRPDQVDAAGSPARRELAMLYGSYQCRLRTPPDGGRPLYDAEGGVWAARTLLADSVRGEEPKYDIVVADGFTSFTATQRDLLSGLAVRSRETLLALPLGDGEEEASRPALYSRAAETAELLRTRFAEADRAAATFFHEPKRPDDALGHIAAALFDDRDEPAPPRGDLPAGQITVVEAGTLAAEVRACVAAVKTLLLRGERADRVVVAARSLNEYADEFHRLADAAGLPVDADRPQPLARRPAVRALLAPWRLEAGRWEYAPLVRLLRSEFFAFDGGGGAASGAASRAVARCLRFANIGDGRRAVVRVAADLDPDREDGDRFAEDGLAPAVEDRRRCADAVAVLSDALEPARAPATFAGWCDRLRALADGLAFAPPAGDPTREPWEDDAADVAAAWAVLDGAAAEIAAEAGDGDPPELALAVFLAAADELLAAATVPGPPAIAGGVRLIDAETARTAGCDHLLLLGLGEGQFPAPPPKSDAAADADAADPDAHARAEMLLFFGVVARPVKTLTLSYPTLDEQARRLFAGPYVRAVTDLFADGVVARRLADDLDPVPKLAAAQTAEDTRVAAARALLTDGDPVPLATLLHSPADGPAVRNALGAVRALAARTRTPGPTAFDGALSGRNRAAWRRRRPADHEFSAGELEDFAANPHRYFLTRVLGVDRPTPPRLAGDSQARGGAMHKALKRVHEEADPREGGSALAARMREFLRDLRPRNATFARWHDGLWESERAVLLDFADRYAGQADDDLKAFRKAHGGDPRPTHLEIAFGERTPDEPGDEPEERFPAAVFGEGRNATRVTGRIDRLDAVLAEDGPRYRVVDYKTGFVQTFDADDVRQGLRLQLAVYAVAARRLGLVEEAAEIDDLVYWKVADGGAKSGLKRGVKLQDLVGDLPGWLDETVPRLAAAIRGGVFPVNPDEVGGAKWQAEFARVSRSAEVRAVAERLEKWPPPWLRVPAAADEPGSTEVNGG